MPCVQRVRAHRGQPLQSQPRRTTQLDCAAPSLVPPPGLSTGLGIFSLPSTSASLALKQFIQRRGGCVGVEKETLRKGSAGGMSTNVGTQTNADPLELASGYTSVSSVFPDAGHAGQFPFAPPGGSARATHLVASTVQALHPIPVPVPPASPQADPCFSQRRPTQVRSRVGRDGWRSRLVTGLLLPIGRRPSRTRTGAASKVAEEQTGGCWLWRRKNGVRRRLTSGASTSTSSNSRSL